MSLLLHARQNDNPAQKSSKVPPPPDTSTTSGFQIPDQTATPTPASIITSVIGGSSALGAPATSNNAVGNNGGPMSTSSSASPSASSTVVAKPAGKKSSVGPIVGGVVGGIAVIAIIIAIFVLLRRRKQKKTRGEAEKTAADVPAKGRGSYDESPTHQPAHDSPSYQPPKAFDPVVAAPISRKEVPTNSATEPKSLAPPPATTSHHEVHMPMSREVNEDGVSLRSASPDLTDVADRHSFVEESGTPTVPRLPRQDREKGGHGSAL